MRLAISIAVSALLTTSLFAVNSPCTTVQANDCQATCELYGQGPGIITINSCNRAVVMVPYEPTGSTEEVTCTCHYKVEYPQPPSIPAPNPPCVVGVDPTCGWWNWQVVEGGYMSRTQFELMPVVE